MSTDEVLSNITNHVETEVSFHYHVCKLLFLYPPPTHFSLLKLLLQVNFWGLTVLFCPIYSPTYEEQYVKLA